MQDNETTRPTLELHPIPRLENISSRDNPLPLDQLQRARRFSIIAAAVKQDALSLSHLIEFIETDGRESAILRSQGLDNDQIRRERDSLPETKKLRSLTLQLGLAKMILAGDWIVNRKKEIPESMGVKPFAHIMNLVAQFRQEHDPDCQSKFVAVDLGCGNGEYKDELGMEVSEDWEIFGYADKIYFTLNGFLKNLLKDKYKGNSGLNEFVDIISTLILRKINETSHDFGQRNKAENLLLQFPENLELIRGILPSLEEHIRLKDRTKLHVNIEFLSDAERDISGEALEILRQYCESPEEFIREYFQETLKDLSPDEKERIAQIDAEIGEIKDRERKHTTEVTAINSERETPEKIKIRELLDEKERILEKVPSLSQYISIFPHNIVVGKFDSFSQVFRRGSVNFGWSKRSSSHLDDLEYADLIEQAALSLAPGGMFLDDGKRESWTRFERFAPLKEVQKKLGKNYRIKVISSGDSANSVFIERGFVKKDGSVVFFSDYHGMGILEQDSNFIDIDDIEREHPVHLIRNGVIAELRRMLVPNKTLKGLAERMFFKDVHPVIERVIGELQLENPDCMDVYLIAEQVKEMVIALLSAESGIVKDRIDAYAKPMEEEKSTVTTLPLRVVDGNSPYPAINTQSIIPVSLLPRNLDVPTLEQLSYKAHEFFDVLKKLKRELRVPPITIFEFDDCFTNSLLYRALDEIVRGGYVDLMDLVDVENFSLQSTDYSRIVYNRSPLMIFGGSEANASDVQGRRFTENACMPLLENISSGYKQRLLAICFGSQSVLAGYGRFMGINVTTLPGAFRFGAFPAAFSESESGILQELAGGTYTVGLTHGWYSDCLGKRPEDMRPLVFETSVNNGKLTQDSSKPPLGFSLLDGKVNTVQFHPELDVKRANTDVYQWLDRNFGSVFRRYKDPGLNAKDFFERNFRPQGIGRKGIVPWVQRDAGKIFLLNVLLKQSKDVLQSL